MRAPPNPPVSRNIVTPAMSSFKVQAPPNPIPAQAPPNPILAQTPPTAQAHPNPIPAQAPPNPIPTQAPQPEADHHHFPKSFLYCLIPVFLFLLYIIPTSIAINAGNVKVEKFDLHVQEVYLTTDGDTTATLGARLEVMPLLKKTGIIHPVPDTVRFNLTMRSLSGYPVSAVSSFATYNITGAPTLMNIMFPPTQTQLPPEQILVLQNTRNGGEIWYNIDADYKWHVKHRKMALQFGVYRHTQYKCSFSGFNGNYSTCA